MTPHVKRRIGLSMLAALLLRLGLWAHLGRAQDGLLRADSDSYRIPAINLLEHGAFSGSTKPPLVPETFRTPGYPVFLAAHRLLSPEIRWPALTQALLDVGTAGLAASCAHVLAPGPWVWVAAALYGLEPMTVAHAPLILSESLFGFLLILSLFLLLRAGPEGRAGRAAASGLLLGAAVLTRPIALYLWLPLGAALIWVWRKRARAAAAFTLCAALLPGLWCLRNQRLFGAFALSSLPGVNLLYYDAAAVEAAGTGVPVAAAAQELKMRFEARHRGLENPFEASRLQSALAWQVIADRPMALLRVHAVSGLKMLAGPGVELIAQEAYGDRGETQEDRAHVVSGRGTFGLLKRYPSLWVLAFWEAFVLGAAYLLSLRGAWVVLRRGGLAAAAWLVPLGYLLVVSSGGWCYYRFRVPLWPLFCALAAAGLYK